MNPKWPANFCKMEFSYFFGRFHVVLVHLPVGILLLAVVLFFISVFKPSAKLDFAIKLSFFIGFASSALSAVCGWLLASTGGYADDILEWHRWAGVGVVVMSLACWMFTSGRFQAGRTAAAICMMALAFAILFAGHLGGKLTHGEGYLLQYAPDFLKTFLGTKSISNEPARPFPNPDSTLVFTDLIMPFLKEKCGNCHNELNNKGGLDLSTKEGFLKGGEHDGIYAPGTASESEIFVRVTLSKKDKKFMPPKGDPLTYSQIRLLEWWINSGASFEKKVGEYSKTNDMDWVFAQYFGPAAKATGFESSYEIEPLPDSILLLLENDAFKAKQISAEKNLIEVSLRPGISSISLLQMDILLRAKDHIVRLNLGHSNIGNSHLEIVKQMSHLTKLNIENTLVGDQGIAMLEQLQHLHSLNLYGTKISDQSIESIAKLPALKTIYLWQTGISTQGIEMLKMLRPDLEVVSGQVF